MEQIAPMADDTALMFRLTWIQDERKQQLACSSISSLDSSCYVEQHRLFERYDPLMAKVC